MPEEIEVRDDEVLIPVTEEEIVVEKREVVKEVLRVRKDVVEDEEVVGVETPMRKTNTAIWMSADGEDRATGIGVRLPATRKIGGEELGAEEKVGTRVEVLASSIKLKRRNRAKTRKGAKEAGRGGKTNHHGGGGSLIRDNPSTR